MQIIYLEKKITCTISQVNMIVVVKIGVQLWVVVSYISGTVRVWWSIKWGMLIFEQLSHYHVLVRIDLSQTQARASFLPLFLFWLLPLRFLHPLFLGQTVSVDFTLNDFGSMRMKKEIWSTPDDQCCGQGLDDPSSPSWRTRQSIGSTQRPPPE